jgi:large subunit ribosomal protein L30
MQALLRKLVVLRLIKCLTVNFIRMAKIIVKQVRSKIKRPENQKRTLQALGLKKMNQVVEHEATPQILGMVRTVSHLVSVEEVN